MQNPRPVTAGARKTLTLHPSPETALFHRKEGQTDALAKLVELPACFILKVSPNLAFGVYARLTWPGLSTFGIACLAYSCRPVNWCPNRGREL